jgi:hypothetical protein
MQRCVTDALQCICTFLMLRELAGISTVCRHWRTAAYRGNATTAHLSFNVRKSELLSLCLASPLCRHLRAFQVDSRLALWHDLFTIGQRQPELLLSLGQVRQVRTAMPWLQELHIKLLAVDSPLMHLVLDQPLFPSSLKTLHLRLCEEEDGQFSSAVIEQLAVYCRALTDLTLRCKQSVSLVPLLSLQTPLRHFRLNFSCGGGVSPAQTDVLKQLRHLRELDCGSLTQDALLRLCEPAPTAHGLQSVEYINLYPVDIPPRMHARAGESACAHVL